MKTDERVFYDKIDYIGGQIDGCDDSVLEEIERVSEAENKEKLKPFTVTNASQMLGLYVQKSTH